MTRLEYLKYLESHLKGRLSREEINEIMRDYGEYFTEGEKQGKTDWEIIITLGDPRETARQIIAESSSQQKFSGAAHYAAETAKSAAQGMGTAVKKAGDGFWKALLIVGLVLLSPVLLGAAAAAIGLLLGLVGILVGILAGCAAVALAGMAALVLGCLYATALPASAVALMVVGSVGVVAGGVLGIALTLVLIKLLFQLFSQLIQWCRGQRPPTIPFAPAAPPPPSAASRPAEPAAPSEEAEGDEPADAPPFQDNYPLGGDTNA